MSVAAEPIAPDLFDVEKPPPFHQLAAGIRTQIAICWEAAEDLGLLRPNWKEDPRRRRLLDTLSRLLDELSGLDTAAQAPPLEGPRLHERYDAVQRHAQAADQLSDVVAEALGDRSSTRPLAQTLRQAVSRLRRHVDQLTIVPN